jgi:hypothetical protein
MKSEDEMFEFKLLFINQGFYKARSFIKQSQLD